MAPAVSALWNGARWPSKLVPEYAVTLPLLRRAFLGGLLPGVLMLVLAGAWEMADHDRDTVRSQR